MPALTPKIPHPIYPAFNALKPSDFRILHRLQSLWEHAGRTNPKAAPFIQPSQKWIGAECGCTRETASRSTTRLHRLGLIRKTFRRRHRDGRQLTCLYQLVPAAARHLARLKAAAENTFHRVIRSAHEITLTCNSLTGQTQKGRPPAGNPVDKSGEDPRTPPTAGPPRRGQAHISTLLEALGVR
jgi:DNA-binding MarR family transcriptional regulator